MRPPERRNAQPHASSRVAVAMVGSIDNHAALRLELELEGVHFRGDDESEVFVWLLDRELAGGALPMRALHRLRSLLARLSLGHVVMIVAGLLRLGSFLRFVSNSVMTGFITAVGVNIVLGQLNDFTGYDAQGSGRLNRALDLLFNFWKVDIPTITVGAIMTLFVAMQLTGRVRWGRQNEKPAT